MRLINVTDLTFKSTAELQFMIREFEVVPKNRTGG